MRVQRCDRQGALRSVRSLSTISAVKQASLPLVQKPCVALLEIAVPHAADR